MLVVIGGHSRNIGKTSVVCSIISALPEFGWTAIKITQYGHGRCSRDGKPCACENPAHPISISEERHDAVPVPDHIPPDSARFLQSGARRAYWVRTPAGRLNEAMPKLRQILDTAPNVIVESNSLLRFVKPDYCAMVVDGSVADFKPSSQRYLDRADALVLTSSAPLAWPGIPASVLARIPRFSAPAPAYRSEELVGAIRQAAGYPALSSKEMSSGSPITLRPSA